MKILIIGSKGFIGSHAYSFFSKLSEYECWASDVVVDYTDDHYILVDSSNANFSEVFEANTFDICINCSGAASVPDSLNNPLRDFSLNTFNVVKLLDAIRKYQPMCRFINLSSAAVYGNPQKLPVSEADPIQPVSPYGLHKMHAEQICQSFYTYWGMRTCSLRIFSAFGPGLKKQLFWDLYNKSLAQSSVTLFGTGNETRDYIYIDDILQAIQLVIEKTDFVGECLNVANGRQYSTFDVVKNFYRQLGWNGAIKFAGNNRAGDPLHWEADITKLKQLGYQQQYDINTGLSKYVQWLKELR